MRLIPLAGNPNLRDTIQAAVQRGCLVEHRRRTGELVFRHPAWQKAIVVNGRRKDTPRFLLQHLRDLKAA
jgi:hypothetical protein